MYSMLIYTLVIGQCLIGSNNRGQGVTLCCVSLSFPRSGVSRMRPSNLFLTLIVALGILAGLALPVHAGINSSFSDTQKSWQIWSSHANETGEGSTLWVGFNFSAPVDKLTIQNKDTNLSFGDGTWNWNASFSGVVGGNKPSILSGSNSMLLQQNGIAINEYTSIETFSGWKGSDIMFALGNLSFSSGAEMTSSNVTFSTYTLSWDGRCEERFYANLNMSGTMASITDPNCGTPSVPEPASAGLMATGLALIFGRRRKTAA